MNCEEREEKLTLFAYGELPPGEAQAIEAHTASCEACRKALAQLRELHGALGRRAALDLSPDLLARSRLRLDEALDAEQLGWRRRLADWLPLPLLPGVRASGIAVTVVLVMVGFTMGWLARPHAGKAPRTPGGTSASPQAASFLSPDIGDISSISQVQRDPGTHRVRITLNAEHRVTLEGSLDDARIRRILVDALKGYDNAGIRLNTLSALQQTASDPSVQEALLYALRRDPNAGVRLEALKDVREIGWSSKVESALIHSARDDKNSGVRVAAIDALVTHAVSGQDASLIPVLQSFARDEPDNYAGIKALAALHNFARTGNWK
ncbi:MAG: HEAT repeat domain-containing protein [Terriglobia bacterium]